MSELLKQAQAKLDAKAQRKPKPPAPKPALEFDQASALQDGADAPVELVQGLLTQRSISILMGASGAAKTFVAIDLALCVSLGRDWLGQRCTDRGMVVYLATEAPGPARFRTRAWQMHHGCQAPHFFIVRTPVNLWDGYVDTQRVIDLVQALETEHGEKCVLIVGDTWASMTPGANENSGEDMGLALKHVAILRDECKAHVMLVAHIGKDESRGLRGWSGVRAAVDTVIEVTAEKDTGLRTLSVSKQRDLASVGERLSFRLLTVDMGVGQWGQAITTCVIEPTDSPAPIPQARRVSEIAGALLELLTAHGTGMRKAQIVKHFDGRYTSSAVYRELKVLVTAGRLYEVAGVVAILKPKVPTGAE